MQLSSINQKSIVALGLTLAAGYVDIAGYITAFHTFTAHMTGKGGLSLRWLNLFGGGRQIPVLVIPVT